MELHHAAVVHAVHVVARENQHDFIPIRRYKGKVLVDGVGCARVPVRIPTATLEGLKQTHTAVTTVEVPGTTDADVVVQGMRAILSKYGDVVETGVNAVAEREIDDSILAAERNGGLGPLPGQNRKALPLATGQDNGDHTTHTSPPMAPEPGWLALC